MNTVTLNLPVEAELANLYENATVIEQEQIQQLFGVILRAVTHGDSLSAVMDMLSDHAEERGLTSEILEQLLADE